MTRYPGRSTGIGAERPPLPNVLPVPATLGTPITETTAIVRMCFLLLIYPPPLYLKFTPVVIPLSSVCDRQFPTDPKGWPAVIRRICLSVVAFRCDVVLYLIDSVSFPIACCILTFTLRGLFSDKRHFRLPPNRLRLATPQQNSDEQKWEKSQRGKENSQQTNAHSHAEKLTWHNRWTSESVTDDLVLADGTMNHCSVGSGWRQSFNSLL